AIEALSTGIEVAACNTAIYADGFLFLVKQDAILTTIPGVADWYLPGLWRTGVKRCLLHEEALLLKFEVGLAALALCLHAHHGDTGLRDVALHDLVHWFAGDSRHRAPKIFSGGVAIGVFLQIQVHAGAEGLFA